MKSRSLLHAFGLFAALVCAVPAFCQKGPVDELGFNPEKLYDFTKVDSVNLFNGNLVLTLPLGPSYHVGPTLSYQFTAVFNGKMWDFETHDCQRPERCTDALPNRRSNAGVGWRVSFGRLLPPTDPTLVHSTDERDRWIYEGPSGDEHAFTDATDTAAGVAIDTSALRLVIISSTTRDVEFPSGERHRFFYENNS